MLNNFRVSDVVKTEKLDVVRCDADQSMADAWDLMNKNNILSIPVFEKGVCLGFVDNIDVVFHLIQSLREVEEWTCLSPLKFNELASAAKLRSCINRDLDPLILCSMDSTLKEVCEYFCSGFAHRALVEGENHYPIGICSQSDLVRKLSSMDHPLLKQDLGSILQSRGTLSTAYSTTPVLMVLHQMVDERVQAVALVAPDNGQLVGNFSASDLRGIQTSGLNELSLPVGDFLVKHSPLSLSPVVVNEAATFGEVISVLVANNLHRVWVVNSEGKPTHVWTLTDIIKASTRV